MNINEVQTVHFSNCMIYFFVVSSTDLKAKRREMKRRQAQAEGLQRRRLLMEKTLQEEQDELAKDYQIQTRIDFIKENMVGDYLRIDVNSITARSLAKAMWSNSTITCLDVSSNGLNDHAGSYIARILKRNKTLLKIEINNNELGSVTCKAFGEALQVNTTLLTLILESNPLATKSPQGMLALADSLRSNNTLTTLSLHRTGIDAATGNALANCMEENDKILFLDFTHNRIDMKDQKRLAEKLDINMAAYEASERLRRANEAKAAEDDARIKGEEESKKKAAELAEWLEDQREKRADDRRQAELDRVADEKREREEKKKAEDAKREADRKAAQEAAEKKAKAAAKKKK